MTQSSRLLLVGACVLAVACGGGTAGDDDVNNDGGAPPGTTIEVTPAGATITVSNGTPATQPYVATARFADGSSMDVTTLATWRTNDSTIASFAGGGATATAGGARGGVAQVTATWGGVNGETPLTVRLETVRVDPSAPPNAPDLFGAASEDPARAPAVVYPSATTLVPPNVGDFEVHWSDAAGNDVFEVAIVGSYVDLRLYTGPTTPAHWFATLPAEWRTVGDSERGGSVKLSVRGLSLAAPLTAGSSAVISVGVGPEDMKGGIYYWAASQSGIFRHDFEKPGQAAEQFYTPAESSGHCVACHALSKDGTRMVVTLDGGDGAATVIDVATRTPLYAAGQGTQSNFSSFNPDGTLFLGTFQGVITVRDASTGATIATVPTVGAATHPDWSPLGNRIVWATRGGGSDWTSTGGGEIYVQGIDATGTTIGASTLLVAKPAANQRAYYPTFSPDGAWVLYNVSDEDSYDDASARVYVVKADGTGAPILLVAADVSGGLTNSWARWAPFEHQTLGEMSEPLFWFTVSSKRAFGVRKPQNNVPQVWMGGFYPARAAAGGDPSVPMFRLPFQDLATSNHIAQWTEVVVPIE